MKNKIKIEIEKLSNQLDIYPIELRLAKYYSKIINSRELLDLFDKTEFTPFLIKLYYAMWSFNIDLTDEERQKIPVINPYQIIGEN